MIYNNFLKKALSLILTLVIINSMYCQALVTNVIGDLNSDGGFNAIDLVILRTKIMTSTNITYIASADMDVNGEVNLKDLVRMKKYLAGEVTHVSEKSEGFSWVLFDGEDSFAIVTAIGYVMTTTCYTKSVCLPGRYVWETSAFIRTDKYVNPELPSPTLGISTVTINGNEVDMQNNSNVWVADEWIWKCKVSYDEISVPKHSEYNCLFTIMLANSPVPYRQMENNFSF